LEKEQQPKRYLGDPESILLRTARMLNAQSLYFSVYFNAKESLAHQQTEGIQILESSNIVTEHHTINSPLVHFNHVFAT